jgi:hypothetical protein
MKIAIKKNDGWDFLTNEGLVVGDEVFPMVYGYHTNGQFFVIGIFDRMYDLDQVLACTGYPSEPHTIKDFYEQEGLQWVHTDKGYSPAEKYFKLLPLDKSNKKT